KNTIHLCQFHPHVHYKIFTLISVRKHPYKLIFNMHIFIQTPRLILRQWQESDTTPFIQMCADDEVMRYFPKKLDATEATAFLERIRTAIKTRGWGLFAVELKATGEFIGFIGLHVHPPEFEIADAPEIGWRLLPQYWNQGYATEGAKAVLKYAFRTLRLEKVISFTACVNTPSERVMQNIG